MSTHPTAIVSTEAVIGENTEIGPYVIIEGRVNIGRNNRILAGAYIGPYTSIGDGNQIHMGAVVGHTPQDHGFSGEESYVCIGNDNVIREHASIHRGSKKGTKTEIGDHCLIMGGVHIAHNCQVGNHVIIANVAALGGYSQVGDRAFISGGSMIHQFVKVGRFVMMSGNARINMDVPPFLIAGEVNRCWGINVVGLRRAGYTVPQINELYRLFFRSPVPRSETLSRLRQKTFAFPEANEFLDFIEQAGRGVVSHQRD
jgi:UDP-N-acetylglucosamine acyltransferase